MLITATMEGGPHNGKVYALRSTGDYLVVAEMEPITADYFKPENAMREVNFTQRHIRPTHKMLQLCEGSIDREGNWIPPLYVGYYALIWDDSWIG